MLTVVFAMTLTGLEADKLATKARRHANTRTIHLARHTQVAARRALYAH